MSKFVFSKLLEYGTVNGRKKIKEELKRNDDKNNQIRIFLYYLAVPKL